MIVREAGGFVESLREGGEIFEQGSVIAANGEIFAKFAEVLRPR